MWRAAHVVSGVVLGLGLAAGAATAYAEPAAKEDCEKAQTEQAALVAGGVKDRMAQGPAQAKARLTGSQMQEIERYIALEETLAFRCGRTTLQSLLPIAEEDVVPGATPAKAPAKPHAPATGEKKAAPPKARAKAKGATHAATSDSEAVTTGAASAAAPKPKAQSKAKPKADDAYRPPGSASSSEPFAQQLAPKN